MYSSKKGTYLDEENRRHGLSIRTTFAEAAGDNADIGRKDVANKLLNKCESMISAGDLPYAMISRSSSHNIYGLYYLEASYKAGNMSLAEKVRAALKKDLEQERSYYNYLRDEREDLFIGLEMEARDNEIMLLILDDLNKAYGQNTQTSVPAVEGKNPTIITNIKDSAKRKDSNRPKGKTVIENEVGGRRPEVGSRRSEVSYLIPRIAISYLIPRTLYLVFHTSSCNISIL
ncbi:MAG: hypothetical protein E6H06_19850 [Bacteroidetes bacterium]|nr:MAG: hypothetical protein E6H06_19850 [Bacteroidota bacterium]